MSDPVRLLLIEDDLPLAELTKDFLDSNGFRVKHMADGFSGLQACRESMFDLIICDIMLPDISGFKLIDKIREATKTPILFLTAVSKDDDQIRGLELGAVDYIVKPVNPRILLARVNNIIFQFGRSASEEVITIDSLEINNQSGICKIEQEELALTPSEFNLLWILAKYIGQPVSREFLFKETVGREYDGLDRTIDGRISRLRKKLESNQYSHFTIRTVWSKGYQLSQCV